MSHIRVTLQEEKRKQVTWARARCWWEEAASQAGPETFQNVKNN
jgi:hypothetical protein